MTEERIEREAERRMDRLDKDLLAGRLSHADYERRVRALHRYTEGSYAHERLRGANRGQRLVRASLFEAWWSSRCHNSEPGTYGHECGEPSTWQATRPDGYTGWFCDRCKASGSEARGYIVWQCL